MYVQPVVLEHDPLKVARDYQNDAKQVIRDQFADQLDIIGKRLIILTTTVRYTDHMSSWIIDVSYDLANETMAKYYKESA